MDLTRHLEQYTYDFIDLADAKQRWADFRATRGLSRDAVPLLTAPDGNAKTDKTAKKAGVFVYGLALASSDLSGMNTCRYATAECRRGCLSFAGHNPLPHARRVQIARTQFLQEQPEAFQTLLAHEIGKAWAKHGSSLRVRLNMLSDLRWERIFPELFTRFGAVRFYDYTKWPSMGRNVPANYDLTFSASERTDDGWVKERVAEGHKVAVVMNVTPKQPLPTEWFGMRVVDGDADDDRWLNPTHVVIGLRAKGVMRRGEWDMVRKVVA